MGDTVTLDTESFHGDYIIIGIMDRKGEKELNTCVIVVLQAVLTEWAGFDPAGYRAYVHFRNDTQLKEATLTAYCCEIMEKYDLPPVAMNDKYFTYYKRSIDFTAVGGRITCPNWWICGDSEYLPYLYQRPVKCHIERRNFVY